MKPALIMWTVYDHPSDYPDKFVARAHRIVEGNVLPTRNIIITDSLDDIRIAFSRDGLLCITRCPDDDQCIIETWL